ncbi:hypothetical protein PAEPH01_2444 [Pancytospora epiphaga]|nr:hypothetical protein PAEPH01_2444 [Pancytospora epiphaga]
MENNSKTRPENSNSIKHKDSILQRYEKDVSLYQREIEELKDKLAIETDPYTIKHINAMLLEAQRVLTEVLMAMENMRR